MGNRVKGEKGKWVKRLKGKRGGFPFTLFPVSLFIFPNVFKQCE
jgi:hypothetical protein